MTSIGRIVTYCGLGREIAAILSEVVTNCEIMTAVTSFKRLGSCFSVDEWLKTFGAMMEMREWHEKAAVRTVT